MLATALPCSKNSVTTAARLLRALTTSCGGGLPRFPMLSTNPRCCPDSRAPQQQFAPPQPQQRRHLTSKPPGSNPLEILRKECVARNLCDEEGSRLPGVHWVMALALAPTDLTRPPNCRTVGIERITRAGMDFVLKRDSGTARSLLTLRGNTTNGTTTTTTTPVAVLHQQGQFLPGEQAEQWRGEGVCVPLDLGHVLDLIPHFTVTSMVASSRIKAEHQRNSNSNDSNSNIQQHQHQQQQGVSEGRLAVQSKSHLTEVMQKTRMELENGDVSMTELQNCIAAFRFRPHRMECMLGGPDVAIMWDRWEWLRDPDDDAALTAAADSASEAIAWAEPKHLVPH